TAKSRSLFPQRMPVKYVSDVPPARTIASSEVSAMRRRARSIRARRSSFVIGVAWLRIDVSAAMPGGSGPLSARIPRPRCAETRAMDRPAPATVDSQRKARRESIEPPGPEVCHVRAGLVLDAQLVQRLRGGRPSPQDRRAI